jgi:3-methyladenine DNA glycosylase AlkD
MTDLQRVQQALRAAGSPKKAAAARWFFKTGAGQYGAGDRFLGVTVPEQRVIARQYPNLTLPQLERLLRSSYHEFRLTALLILVRRYEKAKADAATQRSIVDFYLRNRRWVNNWDLVDSSASYILGEYLVDRSRTRLHTLARSRSLWDRRIAIIATAAFIRRGDFADTFRIAAVLLDDDHDLIHKAVGWMLREVGNRDRAAEERFLRQHYRRMPRTMLRYAIEKFPPALRKRYLAGTV